MVWPAAYDICRNDGKKKPIVYVQGIIGEEQFFFGDSSKFQDTAAVFVHIPLHLLNRKFIKDSNALYGEYQAGADMDARPPLMDFRKDDCELSVIYQRGGPQA